MERHTGTTTIDARSIEGNVGNALDATRCLFPAGSSQDGVPADRRSTHTFQLPADPLLYLTIYKVLGNAIRPQLGNRLFGHGLVPLRPWRELTLNRGPAGAR
jgi:hypothetical protein